MNIDFFITLIPIACAYWVFFDACHNRIGVYRDEKQAIHGSTPIFWGIGTLALLILFLPIYLIRRKGLIEKAKDHPANTDKSLGILVITVLSGVFFWYFYLRY